ncbi:MAG: RNA-binding protein, partial [Candidatus Aenigmarchaeota archaeon]|nr:RNA-binding protein [Candidatus Aenigmarchaeota archaeon]
VDRGIRESKSIDTKKLCVEKGEKVWMVFIDINPINHDGNLLDAAGIAAITALHSAKMPKYDKKEDKVLYGEDDKPLPINNMPIPVTFGFIDGKVMVDPRIEEERAIQTRITITTMTNGNITALQKARPGAFTLESLEEATDISIKLGKEIRKLIKKSL